MLASRVAAAAAVAVRMSVARAAPRMAAPGLSVLSSASVPPLPRMALAARYMSTEKAEPTAEPLSTEPPVEASPEAAAGAGTGAAPADPKEAALKALQEENAKLKASVKELNHSRLVVLADMENVRTIAKRDVDTAKAYALQPFAKRLLDVVDNLGRAVEAVPADLRVKKEGNEVLGNLYEGVSATQRSMLKTLSEFGIVPFGAKGDKFDPHRCEAMMQVPASAEVKADHVSLVLKEGFMLKERVLRPAQVAVAVAQ